VRQDDQGGIPPLAVVRLAGGDAGMDQWGEGEVRLFEWALRWLGAPYFSRINVL